MEITQKPTNDLAIKCLPKSLYRALVHVFEQGIQGCMLVGGTALAGFYTCHRRSDDLDLFTQNETSQKATVLAVKSLHKIGVKFIETPQESAQYYKTTCELQKHQFTIDVVLDPNIFLVGKAVCLENQVCVADLKTLLMTKAATLVSRCSEKDLYDLIWLFKILPEFDFGKLITLGHSVDAGVNGENILLSLSMANLSQDACDFSSNPKISKKEIYQELVLFRKQMIVEIKKYLKKQPALPLRELVQQITRFK